jgi:FdhD protein
MGRAPIREAVGQVWRDGALSAAARAIPEEVAVAITYDGATHAVMMATPADLEDFAIGFSLAEGVIATATEIDGIEAIANALGIDLRIALAGGPADRFWARRRAMAGPVGCGLCGLDSLKEAMRPAPRVVAGGIFAAEAIQAAMRGLAPLQPMNLRTRAMHAAGFWTPSAGIRAVREDVGRHNALDKLCGAMARQGIGMRDGVALLTSRVSIEMVQKLAIAGCPVLAAVSAPTALAVATAEAAGITLIAIARGDGFEVFTHPSRIAFPGDPRRADQANDHVA